jgi:hypothetical protein
MTLSRIRKTPGMLAGLTFLVCITFAAKAVKILAARAWNAALNASLELLLRCCCTHPRSEHEDAGKCTHAGCDCVNLCNCWITVSEMKEYEQPGYIAQRFVPLRAK